MLRKIFPLLLILLTGACKDDYTPKRKGYFRIEYPAKVYTTYNAQCPYTFEYPSYAGVFADSSQNAEPCWVNVRYMPFNATLHITYKDLKGNKDLLAELEEQSRKYAYEHTVKAQEIAEGTLQDSTRNIFITTYHLEGETATPFRFYATDTKNHYIDGAFYFNHRTNIDSIGPVQEFLMKDIKRMLETLKWK